MSNKLSLELALLTLTLHEALLTRGLSSSFGLSLQSLCNFVTMSRIHYWLVSIKFGKSREPGIGLELTLVTHDVFATTTTAN